MLIRYLCAPVEIKVKNDADIEDSPEGLFIYLPVPAQAQGNHEGESDRTRACVDDQEHLARLP